MSGPGWNRTDWYSIKLPHRLFAIVESYDAYTDVCTI